MMGLVKRINFQIKVPFRFKLALGIWLLNWFMPCGAL